MLSLWYVRALGGGGCTEIVTQQGFNEGPTLNQVHL